MQGSGSGRSRGFSFWELTIAFKYCSWSQLFFLNNFFYRFIYFYLFFGCVGSSLLRADFL